MSLLLRDVLLLASALLLLQGNFINLVTGEQLPLCRRHESGGKGEWVKNPNATLLATKSYVCCGGGPKEEKGGVVAILDYEQMPEAEKYCALNNTLLKPHDELDVGLLGLSSMCGDDCCICDRDANTRFNATPRESYVWKPDNCTMLAWDALQFCQVLGERKVLMIGDSTMQQTFAALASLIASGKGTCGPQITHAWSSHLVQSQFHNNVADYIDALEADVVIMTAGAHLHDDGDIWSIFEQLKQSLEARKESGKSIPKLIWKTQNPGHVHCELATGPFAW